MFSLRYRHGCREMAAVRLGPGVRRSAFHAHQFDSLPKIAHHVGTEAHVDPTYSAKPASNFGIAFCSAPYLHSRKSLAVQATRWRPSGRRIAPERQGPSFATGEAPFWTFGFLRSPVHRIERARILAWHGPDRPHGWAIAPITVDESADRVRHVRRTCRRPIGWEASTLRKPLRDSRTGRPTTNPATCLDGFSTTAAFCQWSGLCQTKVYDLINQEDLTALNCGKRPLSTTIRPALPANPQNQKPSARSLNQQPLASVPGNPVNMDSSGSTAARQSGGLCATPADATLQASPG